MTTESLKLAPAMKKLNSILLDPKRPAKARAKMLIDVIFSGMHDPQSLQPLLERLLNEAAKQGASAEAEAMKKEALAVKEKYEQALMELERGSLRVATFIEPADPEMPGMKPRAYVVTSDGQDRYPFLHDKIQLDYLQPGMNVYLDPQGAIVLGYSQVIPKTGEEATFLRRMPEPDSNCVEVSYQEHKSVLNAAQPLLDALDSEEGVDRGESVLFCPRRRFAFSHIPTEKDLKHRFLDESKVPDVIASRDIGRPHWILSWMIKRLNIMLYRTDLLDRFGLRPRSNFLLTGPSGTGKSLTISAFLREFYEMLKSYSGRDDIGSRTIRVVTSEILSEWLGQTDKNIDAFFDTLQAIAGEEFTMADGRQGRLPVTVIWEEAEGMGRTRGEDHNGLYDRLIGTWLRRLDDPTESFNQLPIIWITTSNRADLLDSAMWRRLSGKRAQFTRLDREGVAAVLRKKLKPELPYASPNGNSPEQLRQELIDQVVMWLFSPNGEDQGQVEITMRDGQKLIKHRRDFMTGALIENAVSNAIDQLAFAAAEANDLEAGVSAGCLIDSLIEVTDSLADNLTDHNAADYLDLPEHTTVSSVRRLRRDAGARLHLLAVNN